VENNNKEEASQVPTTDPTKANNQLPSQHSTSLDNPPSSSSSRHSPPSSRPFSHSLPALDGLGSLSEVWSIAKLWNKFKQYLDTIKEGEDSEGQPLTMARYAIFLEMYARLDMEYRRGERGERMVQLVKEMVEHEEQFLGRERCLKCIDSGVRRKVLENVKHVEGGSEEAGPVVFILVYPRVVDKLGEMLGNYQNMIMGMEEGMENIKENSEEKGML